ncbi:acyl carrier protein, partial [Methylogaea oryzae]|uniref:acyl carrier protein n=1 Tax=Methylogaea oryzae TaxID=1295382 RepID=UPI001C3F419B
LGRTGSFPLAEAVQRSWDAFGQALSEADAVRIDPRPPGSARPRSAGGEFASHGDDMIPYAERLKKLSSSPAAAAPPAVPADLLDAVVRLLADVLATPDGRVDPDRSFADLGISSLLAVRLLDRVNRAFGLRLGVDALFSHGDARRLAAHVASLVPDALLRSVTTAMPWILSRVLLRTRRLPVPSPSGRGLG